MAPAATADTAHRRRRVHAPRRQRAAGGVHRRAVRDRRRGRGLRRGVRGHHRAQGDTRRASSARPRSSRGSAASRRRWPRTASCSTPSRSSTCARGEVVQHELLLRMREPDGKIVGPGAYLPIAEQYGLIGEIDRWVVRAAPGSPRPGARSRSTSRRARSAITAILGHIEKCIEQSGADPKLLVFEITETAIVADEAAAPPSPSASTRSAASSRSTTSAPATAASPT